MNLRSQLLHRISIALFLSLAVRLGATDIPQWPRFRGPNGSGIASDDIPAVWSQANRHWKVKLPGVGHGSPVVWGGRVFLLVADSTTGERRPLCVDAASGKILWQVSVNEMPHKHHKFNSLASTTPAVDADRVYFSWGTPRKLTVAAYTHDGTPAWERDLGPVKREQGFACSPIVHDGLVILSNDQEEDCALYALEAATGKVRWKLPREENHSNYSTPCIFTPPGGKPQVIVSSWRLGVTGVDVSNGRQLWQNSVFALSKSERAIGSPVVAGELVIANCAFVNGPKHVVALRPDGASGSMAEAWRLEKTVPHIPSVLAVGERVFLWNDQGIVTCAKLASGEVLWQERLAGDTFGSPVCAGRRLFAVDKGGVVTCIAASDKPEVLGRFELGENCQSTPAVAGGRMFIRSWEHLHAFGSPLAPPR